MNDARHGVPSADNPMPGPGAAASDPAREVTIVETAVALVGNQRVGAANIWSSEYTLPDGTAATGMTAQLFVLGEDARTIVGAGSVLAIGGDRWEVAAVEKPDERRHGRVVLRRVVEASGDAAPEGDPGAEAGE